MYPPGPPIPQMEVHKHRSINPVSPDVSNHLKNQGHFPRADACFVKYYLIIQKWQQMGKLAYIPSLGPGGLLLDLDP